MNIKETALRLAHRKCTSYEHVPVDMGIRYSFSDAHLIDFSEALVAELAKENKPVYAFRRKGLDYFCTCDERRYKELAQEPTLFEVKVLYTLPPTAEQIEQETAEACAKVYLNTYDLTDIADDIRSGKWREYL